MSPVCPLCSKACDACDDELVELWCDGKACDQGTVYHAQCTRDLYSSPGANEAHAFVPPPNASKKTLQHEDCMYSIVHGRYKCIHSVHNTNRPHSYTGCTGNVIYSTRIRQKRAVKAPAETRVVVSKPIVARRDSSPPTPPKRAASEPTPLVRVRVPKAKAQQLPVEKPDWVKEFRASIGREAPGPTMAEELNAYKFEVEALKAEVQRLNTELTVYKLFPVHRVDRSRFDWVPWE